MTLRPNKREVQFKFCVHLFGSTRKHSIFFIDKLLHAFNHLIFDSETHVSTEEIAL